MKTITAFSPLLFLLLSKFIYSLHIQTQTHTTFLCPEIEKHALLSLKHTLNDSLLNSLSSWNAKTDCCNWTGVICNNLTGHVHQLRLQNHQLYGRLDPSLINLKHLRYLDLSSNDFQGTIPPFLGSFASIEYLNLSYSGFSGIIPQSFGNLSKLQTLMLEFDGPFPSVDNLEWLSKLSRLEYLNMKSVNLGKASNWAQVVNRLPSLKNLSFVTCNLDFSTPFHGGNITTSLIHLGIYGNNDPIFPNIEAKSPSVVPSWIFQISSLLVLELIHNQLVVGAIPSIGNTTKLQSLDLDENGINSPIPSWFYLCKDIKFASFYKNGFYGAISEDIANLTALEFLDLSYNNLSGNIPRGIGNLYKMTRLYFSGNYLQGLIPDSIGNMLGLVSLFLDNNELSGGIPASLGNLSSLEYIHLEENKLSGNLPESWGQLFSLILFGIGNNMLEGVVTERHFANLTSLIDIRASRNNLTLNTNPNWNPTFELEGLEIGSWNLGAGNQIPSWILSQKSITRLDLSDTGIGGTVPRWFWNIPFLHLSGNQFRGSINGTLSQQSTLYLSANQFDGPLPRVTGASEVDLSENSFSQDISLFLCDETLNTSSMQILHLGGNQLSGKLPDCWEKWSKLVVLNLANNNISGSIPDSLAFLQNLKSLDLYGNKLSGRIPFSVLNCTALLKIDLSDNNLEGTIPEQTGIKLTKLRFLLLSSNKLSGEIFAYICQLSSLQILDLSNNMFCGTIPDCVGNFTAMASQRSLEKYALSYGYAEYEGGEIYIGDLFESVSINIKGRELQYDFILSLVTSIDLSNNNFSGRIPKELTSLVDLRSLNLSGNHLTGPIPNTFGDMKQLESLDLSRNFLSGEIPDSFKMMSSLNYLDMSHNNLTGRIPESTQIGGLDPSSFVGNNLCGPPLSNGCSNIPRQAPKVTTVVKIVHKRNIQWLYVFISVGFAMGLSSFCSALVLNKSWRETYFELLDDLWDWIYVHFCIAWRKVTTQRRGQVPRG